MGALTDELREFVEGHLYLGATVLGGWKEVALVIADRIDAEHEKAITAAHSNGITEYGSMVAREYVKLPVDADGVPIRVGDKLDGLHYEDGTVTGIQYGLAANGTISELVAVRPHGWDTATWHDPEEYRHHHAPTVEDVLDEFFGKANLPDGTQTRAEIIAEYAAKLRLAEEVDE